MFVATSSFSSFCHDELLAVHQEFPESHTICAIEHYGSDRYTDPFGSPCFSVLVSAAPILTCIRADRSNVLEIEERRFALVPHQHNVPTVPTVPTGGPPEGHVFFTPERDATVPAIAGFDPELTFIDETHAGRLSCISRGRQPIR